MEPLFTLDGHSLSPGDRVRLRLRRWPLYAASGTGNQDESERNFYVPATVSVPFLKACPHRKGAGGYRVSDGERVSWLHGKGRRYEVLEVISIHRADA